MQCSFCQKPCKNKNSLAQHQRLCKSNPDRSFSSFERLDVQAKIKRDPKNQYSDGRVYVISEETRKKLSDAFRGKKHTEETKKQISQSRIAFIEANPDMAPYKINHYSKGPSYPERYWKEILDKAGLNYIEQHQIGRYSLDFAFPEIMIDLEIDGSQHKADERIVNSDLRRTKYLKDLGWQTVRVFWPTFKALSKQGREDYVDEILSSLTTHR